MGAPASSDGGGIGGHGYPSADASTTLREPSIESHVQKKAKKVLNGVKGSKAVESDYNETKFEPGTGPLPPGAEDGFDPNITLDPTSGKIVYKTQEQRQATKVVHGIGQTGPIRIHTDGSSLGNGKVGAFAGVGVYFGPGDGRQVLCPTLPNFWQYTDYFRNVSEALPGARQTNQRAELTALHRALEIVPRNRDVIIISDSKYAIDCVTIWFTNWRRNGWKNAAGKAVENRDIIENVLTRIDERHRLNVRTDFEWVKGHSASQGNGEADRLAAEGARRGASTPGTA